MVNVIVSHIKIIKKVSGSSFLSFWLMIDWLYLSLQLHNFKRHLAQLIGELDDSVAAEEDAIISKVKNITRDYRDVKAVGD